MLILVKVSLLSNVFSSLDDLLNGFTISFETIYRLVIMLLVVYVVCNFINLALSIIPLKNNRAKTMMTIFKSLTNYAGMIFAVCFGLSILGVDISTIVSDTIDMLLNHLSYIKNNFAKNKLIVKQFSNYKDKIKNSNNLTEEEKKYLLGALGELDEDKKRALFEEVLNRFNYNLIVTPKEIDYLIEKLSDIISSALNNALHPSINNY